MTQLTFEPLHPDFGARVRGVTLSGELSESELTAIRDAVDTYSVLCFPDQDMTDEKHLAFTRRLGEPEAEHVAFGTTGSVSYFGTIGNVRQRRRRREQARQRACQHPLSDRQPALALGLLLPRAALIPLHPAADPRPLKRREVPKA